MKHLLTIQEVRHIRDGETIWNGENLKNVIHTQGEEYLLKALFSTTEVSVPTFYYLGLDNRSTVNESDELPGGLIGEPTSFGYNRQPVSSATGFTVDVNDNNIMQATSIVVSFSASGGAWGPVQQLFLTDRTDNSGHLIATVALGSTRTLSSGDQLTMKFAMTVKDIDS